MRLADRTLSELAAAALPGSRSRAGRRPERGAPGVVAIALFWACAGLVAGAGAWIASRLDGGAAPWTAALGAPMVAAAWWVPITLVALWLARRYPLAAAGRVDDDPAPESPGRRRRLSWAVHGVALLSVSFVLNTGWAATLALSGWLEPNALPARAMAGGTRWLHANAAVYAAIVAAATILQRGGRRPSRAGDEPDAERLRVGAGGRTTLVDVDRIDWIEGAGDYACIHAAGREHLSSRRLKELEAMLDPGRFVRIHRSSIVNVDRIRELRHLSHGDYEAELACGTELRVSRRRRRQLEAVLEGRTLGGT